MISYILPGSTHELIKPEGDGHLCPLLMLVPNKQVGNLAEKAAGLRYKNEETDFID